MTKKEFIEKSIEGGFSYGDTSKDNLLEVRDWSAVEMILMCKGFHKIILIHETLLNPKAWEAVGKAEGWGDHNHPLTGTSVTPSCWQCNMHQFLDALIEGKTIEQYLETL
jgi:hypothetical protein